MKNDREFVTLLNTHQNIIHKVCNLYMDTAEDREDLFQEITLQAWKSYQNFRGEAKFSTWLYRVALNTALTYFKKQQRAPVTYFPEILPEKKPVPADPIEQQVQALYTAIGNLSQVDKAIIMLYIEDYNYNDIGQMIGITPNNVAVKINRIKSRLKQQTLQHFEQA